MAPKQAAHVKKNSKAAAAPRKMVKKQQPRKATRGQLKKRSLNLKQFQQQAQQKRQQKEIAEQQEDQNSSSSDQESEERPRKIRTSIKSVENKGDNQQQQSNEDQADDQDSQGSQDQSSEQSQQIRPQNLAVKNMSFRERRGTKMNYLISRKKQEQEDPFWAQHANYFGGDLDANDEEDEEDYVQSSSGRDFFDSDFGQTESQHNEEQNQAQKKENDQEDQDKANQRRKKIELMKKIRNAGQNQSEVKNKGSKKNVQENEVGNRYIHQLFTQQQLLGEAAHTEYFNWLSYQTEKKDYTSKNHHIEGEKVIYRDKIGANGQRQVTYEICGKNQVNTIQDLCRVWKD